MDSFNSKFNQTELNNGYAPTELIALNFKYFSTLYYISFGLDAIVILGYLFIRKVNPPQNRLSLRYVKMQRHRCPHSSRSSIRNHQRLLIYSILAHYGLGIAAIGRSLVHSEANTSSCTAAMVFYVFCDMLGTFLITAIAFNLQLVFVHNFRRNVNLELWYLVASFVFAVILAIIPAIPRTDGYAYNNQLQLCWYTASRKHVQSVWPLVALYLWITVCTVYCAVALVLVLWTTYRQQTAIKHNLKTFRQRSGKYGRSFAFSRLLSLHHHHHQQPHRATTSGETTVGNRDISPDEAASHWSRQHVEAPSIHVPNDQTNAHISYVARVAARVIWFPISMCLDGKREILFVFFLH